jgi:hypothetical protein
MVFHKLLVYLICMVSASALTAQNLIPYQYALGGTGSTGCTNVFTDQNGDYYLFLYVSLSSSQNVGNLGTVQYGDGFIVVSKHNVNHEVIWRQSYGGNATETLNNVVMVEDGFLISTVSNSSISGTKSVASNDYNHIWLFKIDFDGNTTWQKGFFTDSNIQAAYLMKLDDESFLISCNAMAGISGDKTSFGFTGYDGWLIKIDSQGNIIWDTTVGTHFYDFAFSHVGIYQNGDILLSTQTGSDISGSKTENNYGITNYWFVRITSDSGTIVWDKTIGSGEDGESLADFQLINDTLFFLASSMGGATGLRDLPKKGFEDLWFVKINDAGEILEQSCLGGEASETGVVFKFLGNNNIIALIRSNSSSSIDKNENSRGLFDTWLVIMNTQGQILNQKTIGGNNDDFGFDVTILNNGNYVLVSGSQSDISGEKTVPRVGPNSSDVWILEIDAVTLEIVSEHQVVNESVLFPNPANNQINISFSEPTKLKKAILYDMSGKVVLEKDLSQSFESNYVVNTKGLARGVYSLSLVGERFVKTQQVVVE